ncbi:ABC transporter ATP-binding protein [Clostridium botulinum]|uniref:ABC transporter ATP-binding protein n=1 Tax=Clostridium botulinum TaxID=1491 RepID=UPI0007E05079|nr:ABC transporter ATP-binding protein [Clostridium botulinum]KEI80582.1 macrolide ABC transporter ATP-binding protein [Clostridium botulinum B2 331]NEZ75193.1 ABC transporter ATP-binding protein [Clostridium botulinum]NFA01152.1 ABC transporter ATP-binding protein [Clostridium botulinum]NFA33206.1 ABC transporter ATP-binding protein [Clostridium botulinum]NFA86217.1 ABC transporter ATP-binding protein [Clostridium botulinum]
MSIIKATDVKKTFTIGKMNVDILKGVSVEIEKGEFVAIIGESGSGKSTFLNILGGLMPPSSGDIFIENEKINGLSENNLALFRRHNIGFVFQSYNLIPQLTALENVEMPLIFSGISKKERKNRAFEMLKKVGLEERAHHKPSELSGGQQQRVSIARALVNYPKIVLADEPTGNLDSKNGTEILNILKELNETTGQTFVIVTHSSQVYDYANKIIKVVDGKVFNN